MTDDLDPHELDAWVAEEPPAGFADRVVAAALGSATTAATAPPPRRRRAIAVAAIGAVLIAAAVAVMVVRSGPRDQSATGARVATAREEIAIGGRGVAVAEAGAAIAWTVAADGSAHVDQSGGDVFYRVEHGGPFVVATPAGDVRVTGTCFRVEIQPMKPSKSSVIGAAVGAAIAATVVITVYEGGVVVADRGKEERVSAGERAVLGDAESRAAVRNGAALADTPPAADASRDDLLARDTSHRDAIRELTVQVASLQNQLSSARAATGAGDESGRRRGGEPNEDGSPWFEPSAAMLADFAKECTIRFDTPPVEDSAPDELSPEEAEAYGVEPGELDAINRVLRDVHQRWHATLVALYIEATGDTAGADTMSPASLAREIEDKAAPGEENDVRTRISQERAGLAQPPADLSKTSPVERYLRGMTTLGDDFEDALATVIGPTRARALRTANDGWGHKHEMSGCDDRR